MDYIEFEKDLIAILLVVESVHDKNKLIFRYEQINTDEQHPEPKTFFSPYAIVIAKDFDPPSVKDEDAPRTTYRNFDETTLSILTSPNAYGTNVEVQVDDVVFVGHTLGLENNNNLKSFAVFFVLRATTKASVIFSYQEMSKRIGTAIRCEEQRKSYLNLEYAKLSNVLQQREIEEIDPLARTPNEDRGEKGRTKDQIYTTMVEQSVLARILKQIYIDLQVSGEINVTINDWLNVSCCLPHRSISMNCPLPIDYAFEVLSNAQNYIKMFHGLLLVIDPSTLINSLPVDSSSTLSTLVRHARSSYSLSRLSVETGIPIGQTFRLVSHLVYWGRAKIIYPILIDNIYIISPDADLSKEGSLSKLYKKTFRDTSNYRTLQEALAEYSDAITLYDHLARNDDPDLTQDRLQCVEWFLRYRVLIQVHYYYYLVLPNDERSDFKAEYRLTRLPVARNNIVRLNSEQPKMSSSPMSNTLSYSSVQNSKSTDTLRTTAGHSQDEVFTSGSVTNSETISMHRSSLLYLNRVKEALPDETHERCESIALVINERREQDVNDFLKIVKYLNGKYHLEEIASLEKLTRLQILTIIEKFQTIVVRALHPDPNPIFQI